MPAIAIITAVYLLFDFSFSLGWNAKPEKKTQEKQTVAQVEQAPEAPTDLVASVEIEGSEDEDSAE